MKKPALHHEGRAFLWREARKRFFLKKEAKTFANVGARLNDKLSS
jgi:hypothetical protein